MRMLHVYRRDFVTRLRFLVPFGRLSAPHGTCCVACLSTGGTDLAYAPGGAETPYGFHLYTRVTDDD